MRRPVRRRSPGRCGTRSGPAGSRSSPTAPPPHAARRTPRFGILAEELGALGSPDEAVFYTSGRTSNEAAFAYQVFVRAFGTNNLPDCSNMCHESSGVALTETLGIGKGSVSLEDLHRAEAILVVGQNPGTNHPRMLSALEQAKRNGATVVAINPLPEAGLMRFRNPQRASGMIGRGTPLADRFMQIRLGGDLALFKAVNRRLLDLDALDHAFLAERCDGMDALRAELATLDPDDVLEATGLPAEQIEELAQLLAGSERIVICRGLTSALTYNQALACIQAALGREHPSLSAVVRHGSPPGADPHHDTEEHR